MPARSARQYGLMQAIAHGTARGLGGPSKSVAQEFIEKTPKSKRKRFARAISTRRK